MNDVHVAEATHFPTRPARRFEVSPGLVLALLVLLGAYSVVVLANVATHNVIEHFDLWYQIDRGRAASLGDLRTLVDGFYPIGYPLLLRAAIGSNIDALRFSQFLSWLGGALALIAAFSLSFSLTRSLSLALALGLLLVGNTHFVERASIEGTDMLAAGLQLSSVLVLWHVDLKDHARRAPWMLSAVGALLGIAYLVRYTSLVLLPCELVYSAWLCGRPARRAIICTAILAGSFALVSAIQTVPSVLLHGQPFYNWQPKNVWFGIYGQGDWVIKWRTMPDDVSLLSVIGIDPAAFFSHWWTEFKGAFTSLPLWQLPLHAGWIVGMIGLLFDWHVTLSRRGLLLAVILVPLAATALAWLDPRVMIVVLVMQIIPMAWLAGRIVDRMPVRRPVASLWLATTLLAVFLPAEQVALAAFFSTPAPSNPERVNTFLRAAGMSDPLSVVTNDPYLHATDLPARTRYIQAIWSTPNPGSVEQMLSYPEIAARQFLVLTHEQVYGDYREVIRLAPQSKRLVPLALNPTESIYCIMPCLAADMSSDDMTFANGMHLLAHRLAGSDEHRSVYFYWQTDRPLSRSYKTSVRVLAADGTRLFQSDRVPQFWTYPTNHWLPRETVVDFYELSTSAACASGCRLAMVVYDEQSGQPVHELSGDSASESQIVTWPLDYTERNPGADSHLPE